MIKINILFNAIYGHKLDLNKMKQTKKNKNSIAFIGRSRYKNGIVAYVEKLENVIPETEGAITVALGGSVLSSFVQFRQFYTAQNIAVLRPKINMSENELLYYCAVISANKFRYSTCGREANRTFKEILVPDIAEIPFWVYNTEVPNLKDYNASKTSVEIINNEFEKWSYFSYSTLFDIKKGKRLTKAIMEDGNLPFIGAIEKNNGVRQYINRIELHQGNTITVNYNGSVGEAFYQPIPFWASDDVNILYSKFQMNKYIAMFLITLIRQEKYRYNYGRKWHKERMEESIIKLPVKADGTPDFQYMENYIKSLPFSGNI